MMKRKKLDDLILSCLKEIYLNTTPPRDLQEIIDTGEGKQEGWFENYTISEKKFEEILEVYIRENKLKGSDLQYFKTNLYLGPSPRFT